jgi:hypothetical protein
MAGNVLMKPEPGWPHPDQAFWLNSDPNPGHNPDLREKERSEVFPISTLPVITNL